MKVYYNIEVQMAGMCKMTDDVLSKVTHTIGVDYTDYDEIETYSAVMFFGSEVKPSEMRERVRECLRKAENIPSPPPLQQIVRTGQHEACPPVRQCRNTCKE